VEFDEVLVTQLSKSVEAYKKIIGIAIRLTNPSDWNNQNGRPYLQSSGSEKIASPFLVTMGAPRRQRLEREDDKGNYRILPKDQLVERLERYVELARNTVPSDDMFGTPPASAADLLEATRREVVADANRQGIKPQLIDVPQGGIIRPREMAKAPDAPQLDVEAVRQQVYEDVLPAEDRPAAPATEATAEVLPIRYATAENTPPERRRMPSLQDAVKLDSIEGDSMASKADLAEAEARAAEREKDIDADLVELEQMLKGMGDTTEVETTALAEANTFIKNQPTIREAIMAAATCVIGR
jgi:hypothetical protein